MTQVTKVRFITSDNREFTDEMEAKKWQGLLDAQKEYEKINRKLILELSKHHKTADGYVFDPLHYIFYYVSNSWFDPYVIPVKVNQNNLIISSDHANNLQVKATLNGQEDFVNISKLYCEENNAREACRKARLKIAKDYLITEVNDLEELQEIIEDAIKECQEKYEVENS